MKAAIVFKALSIHAATNIMHAALAAEPQHVVDLGDHVTAVAAR